MRFLKPLALYLIVMGIGLSGWCGYEVGNGGHVILCGSQAKVLDLMEGGEGQLVALPDLKDPFLRAQSIVESFKQIDPARVTKWQTDLKLLQENIVWTKENEVLLPTADQGPTVLPAGCEVHQAVVQARDPIANTNLYHVDSHLWSLLDGDSRTALLLHEVIYKDLLDVRPRAQSYLIRPFVRMIVSPNMAVMSLEQYLTVIKNIGFPYYQYKDWYVNLNAKYKIIGNDVALGEVFSTWGDACGWRWAYNNQTLKGDAYSSCADTASPLSLKLGRHQVAANAVYLEYRDGMIRTVVSGASQGLRIFNDHAQGALNAAKIQDYVIKVGGSQTTIDVTPTKSNFDCDDVMTGGWGLDLTCEKKLDPNDGQVHMVFLLRH